MNTCRACPAPVRWVRTEAGRAMPLDPVPVPEGNVQLVGGVAHVLHKDEVPQPGARYVSHFATCPARRPKEPTNG